MSWYNEELFKRGLPTLNEIIDKMPKSKVRLLDVGAGHGILGRSIRTFYPNTKTAKKRVEYSGIDLKKAKIFDEYDKPIGEVEQHDVVAQPLPRNYFDLIVAVFSFPYMTDKFRALENCINALKVGGVLVINEFGEFRIKDVGSWSNLGFTQLSALKVLIKLENQHLDVEVTPQNGIIITKRENKPTKIKVRFIGSQYEKEQTTRDALNRGKIGMETFLTSHYVIPKIRT